MGKKAKEFQSGDFIFAKVKGYPAWPARVQRLNGKKYFVYFYGTGETANLPSNMIFDYAENKDKFLTKTQKRRDFNDGVRQIEHDYANNVPLEDAIGVPIEAVAGAEALDETANDSAINMDETVDTTDIDMADEETRNISLAAGPVEDSDENGALVIDEGGKATKKKAPKEAPKTPATPKAKAKTPRAKAKKDADGEDEIVSRSGRKIRPKRYVDEQSEENTTLPSPAPKKQRLAATLPAVQNEKKVSEPRDMNIKSFNAVTQSELEELKQPFVPADAEKENILLAYLPSGKYVGIKLFIGRPIFKNKSSRLLWDKQAASNAITLKMQLERDQISADYVNEQLVMELNLNDEEKETLDKERETEEKKSRVHFLKTEMKFIELDAQIKTCLSLEKADAALCLDLMNQMLELETKPLMLLKHPNCLETVKRLRNYVGNTTSWDLSEEKALEFSKQAHKIRKQADQAYKHLKNLFVTPDGLTFYEFFQERVQEFNRLCEHLDANEILELVHEPLGLSQPTATSLALAIESANYQDQKEDEIVPKRKAKLVVKKTATPIKGKRQSSRKQAEQEKVDEPTMVETNAVDNPKEPEPAPDTTETAVAEVPNEADEISPSAETSEVQENTDKPAKKGKNTKESKRSQRNAEKNAKADKEVEKVDKAAEKVDKAAEKVDKAAEKVDKAVEKVDQEVEKVDEDAEKQDKEADNVDKEAENVDKEAENVDKEAENVDKEAENVDKEAENGEKPAETDKPDGDAEKVADSSMDEENAKVDEDAEENTNDVAKDVVNNIKKETVEVAEVINTTPKKNSKKAPRDGAKTPKADKNAKDPAVNNEEAAKNEKHAENPDAAVKVDTKTPKKASKDEKTSKDENNLEKVGKDAQKNGKDANSEKRKIGEEKSEGKREEMLEPRAKRSRETRENKKTEAPPPRSPAKRKGKN